MSKSAVSFFAFSRMTFLVLGTVVLLAVSGYAQANRNIRLTNVAVLPGQQAVLSIQLDAIGNETSASYTINFNQAVLTNATVAIGNGVPANTNLGTNTNELAQGRIGILVDTVNTYTAGTRQMATVTFTVPTNAPLGLYPVTFSSSPTPQSVSNNMGALLPTTYVAGSVQVGSTAAGVDISGRVLTPDGRGIRNAAVFITDAAGARRTARTSSFGVYSFHDVEAGQAYTISVVSKQYRFAPRVIQVVDTLTDFDFVGQQ